MNENAIFNFGKKVKQLREEKGWSQEKLALDIDVHKSYIGRIEKAERYPNLKTIVNLANALNVPVKELFDFEHLI